ncbi:C4-dicarboxylate ABC transporter [Rouxiella silvae]|uniref:C4-dicarboxylate ABC transporter n=1 Tax=Rouxiella silvae TaxID=1646373 RepID=A0ABX3U679_9GAMM|nr:AbgT family transporter [Rouxiella silvae]ORJ23056.1 C4-dicarboxylate ABC transporter [Rouxiella silvae]
MTESGLKTGKSFTPAKQMNPTLVLLFIVVIAVVMTWILSAGEFQHQGQKVIPGTYQQIEKHFSLSQMIGLGEAPPAGQAAPVGIIDGIMAIPAGIVKQAGLIVMVLFIGGMFGVLNQSGAIESSLERLLGVTKGNVYFLVPTLMLVFSAGSTFMGLAKEYLLVIPLVVALMNRLGLPNILGLAVVAIAVKVGYLASVTNPYALSIAQPLVGVQIFSGLSLRLTAYALFMLVGIAFVLWAIRRHGKLNQDVEVSFSVKPLSLRHSLMMTALLVGIAFMVFAANQWHWKNTQLSAYYLFLSMIFALMSGMGASASADAFVSGMKKVLIAGLLIGLATAVEIVLTQGRVMDTMINALVKLVGQHGPYISAYGMFICQLLLDVVIPSTSGQAAVTMPILGPLGQLTGVAPQTTVFAFLMGNGLTNMITPTSSGLLIFLASAQVGWTQWAKFVLPLFLIFAALAIAMLTFAVAIGY